MDAVAERTEEISSRSLQATGPEAATAVETLDETRQPFDLTDELRARVKSLGLSDAVEHARDEANSCVDVPRREAFVGRLLRPPTGVRLIIPVRRTRRSRERVPTRCVSRPGIPDDSSFAVSLAVALHERSVPSSVRENPPRPSGANAAHRTGSAYFLRTVTSRCLR